MLPGFLGLFGWDPWPAPKGAEAAGIGAAGIPPALDDAAAAGTEEAGIGAAGIATGIAPALDDDAAACREEAPLRAPDVPRDDDHNDAMTTRGEK